MKKLPLIFLRTLIVISDLFLMSFSLFVSFKLSSQYGNLVTATQLNALLVAGLIWLAVAFTFNLYREYTLLKQKRILRATLRSIILYLIIFNLYFVLRIYPDHSIIFLVIYDLLIFTSLILSRLAYKVYGNVLLRYSTPNKVANILAIASIGGHWVQLLRLMPVLENSDVTFISTKKSLQDNVIGHKYYSVPDANRGNKLNLIRCCMSVFSIIFISKPEIIITTGAAPGLFGMFIGRFFGVKTVWIDSIANVEQLSLSGKIAVKVADKVYTQWQHLSTPTIAFAGNILEA